MSWETSFLTGVVIEMVRVQDGMNRIENDKGYAMYVTKDASRENSAIIRYRTYSKGGGRTDNPWRIYKGCTYKTEQEALVSLRKQICSKLSGGYSLVGDIHKIIVGYSTVSIQPPPFNCYDASQINPIITSACRMDDRNGPLLGDEDDADLLIYKERQKTGYLAKKRILCVHNDASRLGFFLGCFKRWGLNADGVSNSNEALPLIKKNQYSLLITSPLWGSAIDGIDIINELKDMDPSTKAIMITGNSRYFRESHIEDKLRYTLNLLLLYPIDSRILYRHVDDLLETQKSIFRRDIRWDDTPKKDLLLVGESYLFETLTDLFQNKYNFDSTNSYQAAMDKLKEQHYKILLTDNRSVRGPELIQAIKNVDANILCILMHGEKATFIPYAKQMGADELIQKPFDMKNLISLLDSTLQNLEAESNSDKLPSDPFTIAETINKSSFQHVARDHNQILIVDNEADYRNLLVEALTSMGYLVEEAESAEVAIEMAKAVHFAIIITGNSLGGGGLSGRDLIASIKESDPKTFCILTSGYATTEFTIQALKCGAYDFFQKPFKLIELDACLTRAMNHYEALRKNELYKDIIEKMKQTVLELHGHSIS